MKRFYRVLLIFVIGCLVAFLTTRISSVFLVLLPVIAFANGYYSSRRTGILGGFLLFIGYTLTLVWQTYGSYPLSFLLNPFIACLSLPAVGFLGGSMRQNPQRIMIFLGISVIALGWFGYTGIWGYNPSTIIDDIYCSYNTTANIPTIDLNFTLKNLQIEDNELDYSWSLNDPMANGMHTRAWMGNPPARMLKGQGKVSLKGLETKSITVSIKSERNIYDPRGYVMYVSVYNGNTQVGYFGAQKSTFDWDYGVIPPVKRTEKLGYSKIWINTNIESTADGFKATITDIIVVPPERMEGLSLDNMRVSISQNQNDQLIPARLSDLVKPEHQSPFGLRYYDHDNDAIVSKGDFLNMNNGMSGYLISFKSWDNPPASVQGVPYFGDKVENESPDSIRVHSIKYQPVSDNSVDIQVEVSSDESLHHVDAFFTGSGGADHLEPPISQGEINIYNRTLQYVSFPNSKMPNYLILYITDDTTEVIRLLGRLN